jgi:hypothetical protein
VKECTKQDRNEKGRNRGNEKIRKVQRKEHVRKKQEVLGRNNRLLSFYTIRTAHGKRCFQQLPRESLYRVVEDAQKDPYSPLIRRTA